jgi:hypothetical protein
VANSSGLFAQLPSVQYSLGRRSQKPSTGIEDKVNQVANQIRPGTVTHIYSGMEPKGMAAVGAPNRHPNGFAGDFKFYDETTGQQITDQKFFKELAVVMAQEYNANIGYSETGYMGTGSIHIDTMPLDEFPGGSVWGATAKSWAKDLEEARTKYQQANQIRTPDEMQAPLSLAQTQLRDEAIRTAFANPTRALDVPQAPALALARPSTPTPLSAMNTLSPPSRFPGVAVGKVTRAPLEAIPASLTPAPVGRVERAPLPDIGQFSKPAQSLQHPVSAPKPTNLAAAPVGQVTKGPALAPAGPNPSTLAAQYAQYQPSKAVSMPTVAGRPPTPTPTGLPASIPASTLAEQYGQYRPGTVPATPLAHPVSVPQALPPPAQVLAPALAPPKTVRDYPVADYQAPPAPAATAYDVYSGLATQAKDNTGKNTIGSLPDGTTTVTNQWGVTTGMTPYGKQTAVGSLPGITGPVKDAVKGAVPAIGGGLLGSMVAGPLGGIIGAAIAREVAKPGGLFSGGLGRFPGAPTASFKDSTGKTVTGIRSPTFSNLSRGEMNSISPKAAADIAAGRGGLF